MLLVNDCNFSQVVYNVTYTDQLNSGPSVLNFELPALKKGKFSNGDTVIFTYGSNKVFYGFLFKIERGVYRTRCTAYDQLRYLKASVPLMRQNETLKDFVGRALSQAGDRIRVGKVASTEIKLTQKLFDSESYLDMLYKSIDENRELNGYRYALRDEFGAVTLRDLYDLRTGVVIGDDSLATDYKYSCAIGDNACNYVKVAQNSRDEGMRNAVTAQDSSLITKWGKLAAFKQMSQGNKAQMQSLADSILSERGKESETLSVDCIGDLRLRAGCGAKLLISQEGIEYWVLITRASHSFSGNEHTMSLDIERSEWQG